MNLDPETEAMLERRRQHDAQQLRHYQHLENATWGRPRNQASWLDLVVGLALLGVAVLALCTRHWWVGGVLLAVFPLSFVSRLIPLLVLIGVIIWALFAGLPVLALVLGIILVLACLGR